MSDIVLYNSSIEWLSKDYKNYNIYKNTDLYQRAKNFFVDISNQDDIANFKKGDNRFIILNNKFKNFLFHENENISFEKEKIDIKDIFNNIDLFVSIHKNPFLYDNFFQKNLINVYHFNMGKIFNPLHRDVFLKNTICFDSRDIETVFSSSDIRLFFSDLIEKIPNNNKNNNSIETLVIIDLSILSDSLSTYYDDFFDNENYKKYKFSGVYDKVSSKKIIDFISYINYLKNEKNNYFNKPKIKGIILDLSKINDFNLCLFDKILLECRLMFE